MPDRVTVPPAIAGLVAFDPVLKRPACAIVAAAFGADTTVCHEFPVDAWLLSPTPDMGVFPLNDEILAKLKEMVGDG